MTNPFDDHSVEKMPKGEKDGDDRINDPKEDGDGDEEAKESGKGKGKGGKG